MCKFSDEISWKLVYRASQDGYAAKDFHAKCDGIKETLTVIKTTDAYVFGGYTSAAWSQNKGRIYDNNAFIFSLTNKNNSPVLIKCSTPQNAIYCDYSYGPFFG